MTKNNDEYHQIEFNIAKDDLAETEKILESYQPISISMQGFGEEKIYEPLPGEMPIWEKIRVKAMYQNIKNLSDLENEIIKKTNIKILNNKVIKAIGGKDWQEVPAQGCAVHPRSAWHDGGGGTHDIQVPGSSPGCVDSCQGDVAAHAWIRGRSRCDACRKHE